MAERPGSERVSKQELTPDSSVTEALRGKISEPIETVSNKPGFESRVVTVRIAEEGPGLFGLADWRDNKEWSGITNHVLLSARYAVYFAQKMSEAGHRTNPQRILNGMIVSHPGRRQWDEARWYPEIAPNSAEKQMVSNEKLGLRLIYGKVTRDTFELVAALADDTEAFSVDPTILDSLDYKIANYVDHRTSQQYSPLNRRMGDFLLGNFYGRDQITPDLKETVCQTLRDIIELRKALGPKGFTLADADKTLAAIGVKENSSRLRRKDLIRLILQDADTEAALIQTGIDPDNISDETVPMPAWEDEFRTKYVRAAKDSIIKALSDRTRDQSNADFPPKNWWSQYAHQIYSEWYAENVDPWDPFQPAHRKKSNR